MDKFNSHQYRPKNQTEDDALLRTIKQQAKIILTALETANPSRELSIAKTKIEECIMWATKGLAASKFNR